MRSVPPGSGDVAACAAWVRVRANFGYRVPMIARTLTWLFARPEDLSGGTARTARVDALAVLAPFADLGAYFAAVGQGASAGRAQVIGFAIAAALNVWPLLRAQSRPHALHWTTARYLHLIALTFMAFLLRSGVFG